MQTFLIRHVKNGQVLISCYQTIKPHLHRNQFKILTFPNFYLSLITSNISYVFHLLKEITPPSILAFFGMRSPGYDFFVILSNCDLSFRSGSFSHKHLHHSQLTPRQTFCLSTPSPPPPSRTPLTIPPPHLSTAVSRAWRSSVPAVEQRIAAGSNTQQARRATDGGGKRCGQRG